MNRSEEQLMKLVAEGDPEALGQLFLQYLPRLKGLVSARIDPRIAARVDESDVMQEVHVEVIRRMQEYLEKPSVPFYDWMRFLTKQKLDEIVRRHLGVQARDVRRERPLKKINSGDSSMFLAGVLSGKINSPSSVAGKAEVKTLINAAVNKLSPIDREILLLRHVEQLRTAEAAEQLDISQNTCRQRHIRALKQLRELLLECGLSWEDL